jgi:hypothetical protein
MIQRIMLEDEGEYEEDDDNLSADDDMADAGSPGAVNNWHAGIPSWDANPADSRCHDNVRPQMTRVQGSRIPISVSWSVDIRSQLLC